MKFESQMLTLYAVTDSTWLGTRRLAQVVEQAILGGVTIVQFRQKEEDGRLQNAKEVQAVCKDYQIPFIVNDSISLARQIQADGVHLGQKDIPKGNIREMTQGMILGMSANTVECAQYAVECGADYLGVGAVFGTKTKQDAKHLSPQKVRQIVQSVSIPVVAIGGIAQDNILQLKDCGIQGIAVVSALFGAQNPQAAAQSLLQKVRQVKGNTI